MEAFDEPVIPWARRGDVDSSDVLLGQPLLEILRDELRSVVGPDELWRAAGSDGGLDQGEDLGRTDPPLGSQDVHLLRVLVEHREHA